MKSLFIVVLSLLIPRVASAEERVSFPADCWAADTASALQDSSPDKGERHSVDLGLLILADGDTLAYRRMTQDKVFILGRLVPPTQFLNESSTLVLRSYSPLCDSCAACQPAKQAVEVALMKARKGLQLGEVRY